MIDASIVVTSYNVESYLEAAILSIINGTTEISYEIIVVDDGSTDASPRIAQKFVDQFPNVRAILWQHNTIGGVSTAANAGINAARGEFIGFLDGDDLVLPGTFDRLVKAASSANADLAVCSYEQLDVESGAIRPAQDMDVWSRILTDSPIIGTRLHDLLFIGPEPWKKIYRKGFLTDRLRFPVVDNYFEDVQFHWSVVLAANRAVLCDFVGFRHRVNRPGQSVFGGSDRRAAALFHYSSLAGIADVSTHKTVRLALITWFLNGLSWIGGDLSPDVSVRITNLSRALLDQFSKKEIVSAATTHDGHWKARRAFTALVYFYLGSEKQFLRRISTQRSMNFEKWMAQLTRRIWL